MIKENIRDYFVNAMRFYAQLGKPSLEELNGILITNLGIPLPFENSVYYTGFNELNKNLLAEYEDMKAVIAAATSHITKYTTYYNALHYWILSLKTIEEINAIYFGVEIPDEFKSEVMK